jgi:hypothetical protein
VRKVLLLEFNEVTWTLMDPLIAAGKMPNLRRLRDEGASASPEAVEAPEHLDPWVTWVTLLTGVKRETHGATVLEQEDTAINAKRLWHYVVEAGHSVGVFGSISAYPPRPVPGFIVPGPFAPGPETYPDYVRPVQAVNRRYTKVHNKLDDAQSPLEMARDGLKLLRLGLRPNTCVKISAQLVRERIRPHDRWRRVALQPLLNYDLFDSLYRRYRPTFATWHTNHVAHYMHHYWRAHDDKAFLTPASDSEKRKYGDAISYGHQIADEVLGRFMQLADDDTVIVLASSMGHQPYVKERFAEGRYVVQFLDITAFLQHVGVRGVTGTEAVMAPQWNITIPDDALRAEAIDVLGRCRRCVDAHESEAVYVVETGHKLTVTPAGLSIPPSDRVRFSLPGTPGEETFDKWFVAEQPTTKQGCHHPTGSMVMWGPGIARGVHIEDTTALDIAPTILSMMGIDIPECMRGRVLSEAWGSSPSA